jgi:hypothetical protein
MDRSKFLIRRFDSSQPIHGQGRSMRRVDSALMNVAAVFHRPLS